MKELTFGGALLLLPVSKPGLKVVVFRWLGLVLCSIVYLLGAVSLAPASPHQTTMGKTAAAGNESKDTLDQFRRVYQQWRAHQEAIDYSAALASAGQCLKMAGAMYGRNDVHTARVLTELGELYLILGRFADAKKALKRAIDIRKAASGIDPLDLAESYYQCGCVCEANRDYNTAENVLQVSLRIARSKGPEGELAAAKTLRILGEVARGLGDHRKAESLCRESLQMCERVLPAGHVEIAHSAYHLGRIHCVQNLYSAADGRHGR